jgi:hypothetical protein
MEFNGDTVYVPLDTLESGLCCNCKKPTFHAKPSLDERWEDSKDFNKTVKALICDDCKKSGFQVIYLTTDIMESSMCCYCKKPTLNICDGQRCEDSEDVITTWLCDDCRESKGLCQECITAKCIRRTYDYNNRTLNVCGDQQGCEDSKSLKNSWTRTDCRELEDNVRQKNIKEILVLAICSYCKKPTLNLCDGVRCEHSKEMNAWICTDCKELKGLCQECIDSKSMHGLKLALKEHVDTFDGHSNRCLRCLKWEPGFQCTRCHVAKYCDKVCQRLNWERHKKLTCKKTNDAPPAATEAPAHMTFGSDKTSS